MKEYRLVAWAELPAPFDRMAYRRMLTAMSHRYVSEPQLVSSGGVSRAELRQFLDMLHGRGLLVERDLLAAEAVATPRRPLGSWLRRTLSPSAANR